MTVESILEPIIAKQKPTLVDYIGEGGLLYCGRCHQPKQILGKGFISERLLPISCACVIAEQERDEEEDKRRRIENMRLSCLPVEAMHKDRFDLASEVKHITIAKRYVSKWDEVLAKNIGLLLWGNTGSGKTFTAHCIANALIDREIFVRLYSVSELIQCMGNRDTRPETVRRLRAAPLVIVDDVGAERGTESSREMLCAAIDERSEAGKPLIVTTNYTLNEMRQCQAREQQRIFDRLTALCVPVAVIGESRRVNIGEEKLRAAKDLLAL